MSGAEDAGTTGDRHPRSSGFTAAPGGLGRVALVVALAAAAWVAALGNGRLADDSVLLDRRLLVDGAGGIFRFFAQDYWAGLHEGGLYRPLALALLALQRLVLGDDLAGFRLVSLGLHAACSLLCLSLLERLLAGRRHGAAAALFGAAVFACHPVHAEAVITIYGQSDLWAALFALAALERHFAWAGDHPRMVLRHWVLVSALYLASLLCKESAILLPLAASAAGLPQKGGGIGSRPFPSPKVLGYAVPLAVYLAARFAALGPAVAPAGEGSVAFGYPLLARMNLALVTVGEYLRLLLLPWGQTVYYGHLRDAIFGRPLAQLAWIGGVAACWLWWARRAGGNLPAVAGLWLAAFLAPVSNVVPIGTAVAERCLYLPSLALSVPAAAAFLALLERGRRALAGALAALTVAGGLALSIRVAVRWRTPLSHWRACAADHPRSPKAHAMVGFLLLQGASDGPAPTEKELLQAEHALETALSLNPRSPEALLGSGLLWLQRGRPDQAIVPLEKAQALRPGDPAISRAISRCRSLLNHAEGRHSPR